MLISSLGVLDIRLTTLGIISMLKEFNPVHAEINEESESSASGFWETRRGGGLPPFFSSRQTSELPRHKSCPAKASGPV